MIFPRLGLRTLFAYGGFAFVLAVPTIPVYVYLPDFYGDDLGLGLAVTGWVLLAARLFDAVSDPIIGYASDRFSTRWGRRKPWIAMGAILAGFALYNLLVPPAIVGPLYLGSWLVLLYAGWTMISVPYFAWAAELSDRYDERTRITAVRETFYVIGILAASAAPVLLTSGAEEDARHGLMLLSLLTIGIGIPLLIPLLRGVPDRRMDQDPTPPTSLRAMAQALRGNGPFVRLLLAWTLNGLANGIPAVLFLLFLEYGLEVPASERPLYILTYFAAAVLSIPLWQWLSRMVSRHQVWCAAMGLAIAAFAFVPFLTPADAHLFLLICGVTGAALGADLILPPAIQADVVDLDELRHGAARPGLFFAFWGMATKLSVALAAAIGLGGAELAGFSPEAPSEHGRMALAVIYSVLPLVFKAGAVSLVWQFPLDRQRQQAIRRRIDRRRAGLRLGGTP